MKIVFIGGGNMAQAMAGGLVQQHDISVFDPSIDAQKAMAALSSKIQLLSSDKLEFMPDVLVLAVKPQIMSKVCSSLQLSLVNVKQPPVVLSIAAGIELKNLQSWLGPHVPIVRSMPNTPALVGEGAAGMYASSIVSPFQKSLISLIMDSICRKSYWVTQESHLDIVTGLSGSGPAYFFLMMEALESAAVELGLPQDIAKGLAIQTCLGAGTMASQSSDSPMELRRKVTSPQGTTEAAIKTAEANQFGNVIHKMVTAASKRSKELGSLFSSNL